MGVGTEAPTQKLDVDGNIRWGFTPHSNWGQGLLSQNSGWASGNYPTLGSDGNKSLIMLHNPHIPFRSDNVVSNYMGKSGIKMATDVNVSNWWEMGLGGDFFYIYRNNSQELMRIKSNGNVGIGTSNPVERMDVSGNLKWGTNGSESWGVGLLTMESGWSSNRYPTLGSISGSSGSLIMFHNPHIPFRSDNSISGYAGKAGIRMAADQNVSSWWDMGLAGDFFHIYRNGVGELFRISSSGNVGIGTQNPSYRLEVAGTVRANTFSAVAPPWSDFVFEPEYKLLTLEEVEQHIQEKGHLPEIPSEAEVTENGINLGEMNAKLLQKVEELTLYLIEQNKQIQAQQKQLQSQSALIEQLQWEVSELKTK